MAEVDMEPGWIRPEERPTLRRLEDLCWRALQQNTATLSDFLTPREQFLAASAGRHAGVDAGFWGGYAQAERQRALFSPAYWTVHKEDYEIGVMSGNLGISAGASHGDVLGSILGTGLKRSKIGDIAVGERGFLVAVSSDVEPYLLSHWSQVGKMDVHLEKVSGDAQWPVPDYRTQTGLVSSLRLDALLAEFCRWSRSQAQAAIAQGKTQLNFAATTKTDERVEVGDIISIRGFGRIKLAEIQGETRRGKLRVTAAVLKS